MKRLYFLLTLVVFMLTNTFGQAPAIVWDKTIGGNDNDVQSSITATSDGGFVIAGYSYSGISGDKTEVNKGDADYWIVKINSSGQKIWEKTIGGSRDDRAESIVATSDGGFVVAGTSNSGISGDKTESNKGYENYWIVKLNSSGQKVWDKTIGGNSYDAYPNITATSDGGFVIAGHSYSGISGDKTEAQKGNPDYWIVKLNSSGQKIWDKTIGGRVYNYQPSITATSDGGFVIAGDSNSRISGDKTEANKGGRDYWIVKLSSSGQKVWDKTIGGDNNDYPPSITATLDGGFVIAGTSYSGISGDKTEANKGDADYWIVKLNSSGQKIWDKTIGGNGYDADPSITATSDGGFVIAGTSKSDISGDKTGANKGDADADYWIVKLNSSGQKVWDKTIGGDDYDAKPSITATSDGGFVIAGTSYSDISDDKTENSKGGSDYWIVKLGEAVAAKPIVYMLETSPQVPKGTSLKVQFKAKTGN